MTSSSDAPVPLLFLIGDTGGGHRSAAAAVAQALTRAYPGQFAPLICDPLRGPDAPARLRWLVGLYGPNIRLAPWLWGVLWRSSGSPRALGRLRRTLLSPTYGSVARAVAASEPAMIVAFHPMTADPAVRARDQGSSGQPVVTVVTDLITTHLSWRDAAVDRIIVPSAAIADRCQQDGMPAGRFTEIGLPVAAEFCQPPATGPERRALQASLGLRGRFLVLVTGGAEGSGGLHRRAAAILRHVENVDVAVICGRNQAVRRRLNRLAARTDGRLTVCGFVDNMADWLRCADVVVGKAGPGTIAEAACCAAPLVLTSYVPGQEAGNAEFVVEAGAGIHAPRTRQLAAEIGRLRDDRATLAAMRAASGRLGRPEAAADIARLLAAIVDDTATCAEPAELELAGHRPHMTGGIDGYPLRVGLTSRLRERVRRRASAPPRARRLERGRPGRLQRRRADGRARRAGDPGHALHRRRDLRDELSP
ncbi:MAG TPA: glycosyltransferase [Streptosporangiaceae bacterium]